MSDIKKCCFEVFNLYGANLIDYEEFKRRLRFIDSRVVNGQLNLKLTKEDIMIHFHYNGKRVCSMPTAGLTFPQISAGRKLIAEKLQINPFDIQLRYNNKGAV